MDEKFTYGALSIVVDTSGSMNYKFPTERPKGGGDPVAGKKGNVVKGVEGDRRLYFALDALKQVLQTLPEGTEMSVLRFAPQGKDTIPVFVHDKDEPIHEKWRKSRRDALLDDLQESDMRNNSPIADAIVKSMEKGFRPGYTGPKVTLVLTDGCDNTSGDDEAVRRKVQKAHVDNPGIQVIVVCFLPEPEDEKDKEEKRTAENQFAVLKDLGGDLLFPPDKERLAETIEKSLRPRLQLMPDVKPMLVNRVDSKGLEWKTVPAISRPYDTKVQGQATERVDLLAGQNLMLEVFQGGNLIKLRRAVIGKQKEMARHQTVQDQDWLATMFQQRSLQNLPRRPIEQVVLLEKLESNPPVIRQAIPPLVWLDVEPTSKAKPSLIKWHNDWNIAAPAFRLQAENWPIDEGARVQAWWTDNLESSPAVATGAMAFDGQTQRRFKAGKTEITVESLRVESDQEIEVKPGIKEKRRCLVFRVEHELNRPVWIRWTQAGLAAAGEEHCYFSLPGKADKGKYTAKFYDYIGQASGEVKFEIICLTTFKEKGAAMHASFTQRDDIVPPDLFRHNLDKDR